MNMNLSYPSTMLGRILAQLYVFGVLFTFFFLFTMKILSKIAKIFFYQKYVHLGKNTLIYCSQKTVVHVHVNGFLKNSFKHAKVMQTESKQEVTKQ